MADQDNDKALALIMGAKRAEDVVPICMRADLEAEVTELERQIVQLQTQAQVEATSLAGPQRPPELLELARQQEALREQMREATIPFRLRALPPRRWTELLAKFPPRKGNKNDERNGVNVDEHAEVMVRECLVFPKLSDSQWMHLLTDALSDGSWNKLVQAAWNVNQRDADVPFSLAGWQILRNSGTGLKPPSPSASPFGDLTGGSPSSSPSTSTTTAAG